MPRTAVCLILILFGVGAYGSISNMGQAEFKINRTDMSDDLQQEVLQVASLAFNKYESKINIARYIVKEFEKRQGGDWNCIVGNCASSVTHKTNGYINFSFGDITITVFRSP